MKYGKFTIGQTIALINKLGGIEVAAAILANEGPSLITDDIEFLKSLPKCLEIRDLLRAWGEYLMEDGKRSFAFMISQVASRAENLAGRSINEMLPMDDEVRSEILVSIENVQKTFVVFQTKTRLRLEHVESSLEWIKLSLKKNDRMSVYKYACELRGALRGIEELNNAILAPYDEACITKRTTI